MFFFFPFGEMKLPNKYACMYFTADLLIHQISLNPRPLLFRNMEVSKLTPEKANGLDTVSLTALKQPFLA